MGIEIERKFLSSLESPYELLWVDKFEVSDYYINPHIRIRKQNDEWIKNIKSSGTLCRIENEFKSNVDEEKLQKSLNMRPLVKTRIIVPYHGHNFEINFFKDILYKEKPLVMVEVELNSVNEKFDKPEWIGEEVTEDKRFYGYNLFKSLQNNIFQV